MGTKPGRGETAVQTLKTAAIVVLMMTVLYGAYVSMTTPPDALPPEITDNLIVDADTFDIGEGFPEGLGQLDPSVDFGIDDGTAGKENFADAGPAAFDMMDTDTQLIDPAGGSMSMDTINQSFADLPEQPTPSMDSDSNNMGTNSFSMSDLDAPENSANTPGQTAIRLPAVAPGASTPIAPEAGREYTSTGMDYSLPEPNVAVESAAAAMSASTSQDTPERSNPGLATSSIANSANQVVDAGLRNAIATADRQYQSDRRREALATLSLFYETPNLATEQRDELLIRLDPLAREVIYSPEHLLAEPHRVGPNETLMDIAGQYEVPWQLLANINGVSDPITVLPGTDLKVVRGPFRADVDLANRELTLFLGDLYAGRFPIAVGSDPLPRAGAYTIQEKQSAKTYYDMSGTPIPPGNPRNPYGSMWIDLGSGLSIHGSPQADSPTDQGCISLAGNYSRDVFGILSEGSSVTIR